MQDPPKDDVYSNTQEYLDSLAERIQRVTADYLELEKEKRALLSQPQPLHEQLKNLLMRLEHQNEQLRTLQEQVSKSIENLRQWQKLP